jgi:hypothetical protein
MAALEVPKAVIMMMLLTGRSWAARRRMIWMPSCSGMRRSISSRSGSSTGTMRSTSLPLLASRVS